MENQPSNLLSKVPQITIVFWIIKVLGTTVGETAADFLSFNLHVGLTGTSLIMAALLLVSLVIQFRSKQYVPWIYWLTVILISIVGTLITDDMVDNFGIPLKVTTIIFGCALALSFIVWYAKEKTLSIHSIFTTKRELFYWAAILFTFAFGTAAGDLLAEGLGWGFGLSALVFVTGIAAATIGFYFLNLNSIFAFWVAYILTRPLGASCGDLLTQAPADGGLGISTSIISAAFLITIIGLVAYLTMQQKSKVNMQ
ncbi:MAG: hypothetical protein RJA07_1839 [Bacteroidota bacterium]|jgi:uncharacterized membrane-anchored protein